MIEKNAKLSKKIITNKVCLWYWNACHNMLGDDIEQKYII